MTKENKKSVLDISWIYRLSQAVFALGAEGSIKHEIATLFKKLPSVDSVLDIGCGPSSYLWLLGVHPIGLDISLSYAKTFRTRGGIAIEGSATDLPFRNNSLGSVWSFGLLHHLANSGVSKVIREMMRVCQGDGYIVIFDGVRPDSFWRRPLASVIRMLDRGAFMRRQEDLENLLPDRGNWACKRFRYALTGLEGVLCIYRRNGVMPYGI